ncbi:MAG TPA: hypothetical protein VFW83_04300 [Bryobacteraceae bacterium]|nr:hypothetical protein [Bryobacteraceae bacterium]
MAIWLAVGSIGAVGSAAAAIGSMVGLRLRGYRCAASQMEDADAAGDFTLERYAPMARLLSGEDLEFLRERRECAPHLAARWERARKRIFRMYLRDLAADFQCLHARARALAAESPEEYSDLVSVLMRQQLVFWRALAGIELHLAVRSFGIKPGFGIRPADLTGLTGAIEALRAEIARSTALCSPLV